MGLRTWGLAFGWVSLSAIGAGCDQVESLTGQFEELQEGLTEAANPADVLALAEQARQQAEQAAAAAEERIGSAAGGGGESPSAPSENTTDVPPAENTTDSTEPSEPPQPGRDEPPTANATPEAEQEAAATESASPAAETSPTLTRDGAGRRPDTMETGQNPRRGTQQDPARNERAGASDGSRPRCSDAPDPSQCVIDRYQGRARHAFQLIALADAYNAKGRFTDAVPLIQQLLQRYPTHARADRYRQLLESRGVEPAR